MLRAPRCPNTHGLVANPYSCTCNHTACRKGFNLFCTASNSDCREFPTCPNQNGMALNPSNCSCGSAGSCTSSTGLYCVGSRSECNKRPGKYEVGYIWPVESGQCGVGTWATPADADYEVTPVWPSTFCLCRSGHCLTSRYNQDWQPTKEGLFCDAPARPEDACTEAGQAPGEARSQGSRGGHL